MAQVPACVACRFWEWNRNGPDYRTGNWPSSMLAFMAGECRRRAPERTAYGNGYGPAVTYREWPIVAATDGCGEFQQAFSVPPNAAEPVAGERAANNG